MTSAPSRRSFCARKHARATPLRAVWRARGVRHGELGARLCAASRGCQTEVSCAKCSWPANRAFCSRAACRPPPGPVTVVRRKRCSAARSARAHISGLVSDMLGQPAPFPVARERLSAQSTLSGRCAPPVQALAHPAAVRSVSIHATSAHATVRSLTRACSPKTLGHEEVYLHEVMTDSARFLGWSCTSLIVDAFCHCSINWVPCCWQNARPRAYYKVTENSVEFNYPRECTDALHCHNTFSHHTHHMPTPMQIWRAPWSVCSRAHTTPLVVHLTQPRGAAERRLRQGQH